jgi:hypothetical protein
MAAADKARGDAVVEKAAATADAETAAADSAQAAKVTLSAAAPTFQPAAKSDKVRGLLRISTRPTLNKRTKSARLYKSIHPGGTSCSDLGLVLVRNDPPARRG